MVSYCMIRCITTMFKISGNDKLMMIDTLHYNEIRPMLSKRAITISIRTRFSAAPI